MTKRLFQLKPASFSAPSAQPVTVCLAVYFLLACTLAMAQASAPANQGGTIRGVVKSGNMPIPGVAVTAVNPQTRQRVVTWTDVDGAYSLQVPEDGSYFVRTQMAAFAPAFTQVTINAANRTAKADLEMFLQSRAPDTRQQFMQQMAAQGGRGFQSLSVTPGEGGTDSSASAADDPSASAGITALGTAAGSATESVAVSGSTENSSLAGMSSEELQQRVQEFRDQQNAPGGGGFRGGEGGGFFGGGGFGGGGFGGGGGGFGIGRGRFNINKPHGSIYYSIGDSALNAAGYSLPGTPTSKPNYFQSRFGATLGGPLNIPKIYKGGDKTSYFINYTGNVGENPFDQFATVPTLAERNGDFSATTIAGGRNAGAPVQIFDPTTQTPFLNNTIPANRINSAAAGLLAFIPLPNLPGDTQNFHRTTSFTSDINAISVRINHILGSPPPRRTGSGDRGGGRGGRGGRSSTKSINFGLSYQTRDSVQLNPFPSIAGTTRVHNLDVPVGYTRSFGKINNILRFDFNQSRSSTRNLYAFAQNITGNLGINGVSQNPFDWGLPGLSFSNFNGIQDVTPAQTRNQTYSISDFMVWSRGRHTLRWGGDFRLIQLNIRTDRNARGTFTFSGLNTAQLISTPKGLAPAPNTGFDFADFLLGLPQQTSAQFGTNNYDFHGNFWDMFVQDEWRATSNLSFNLGLRYEYVSPYTESHNQIANLIFTPGLTAVLPVLPGQSGLPASLVRPDRNNFAPRVGIAWKATPKTVVRASYGMNYNTGAYASMIQQLAFQPPFSFTQTNTESSATPLTLQNGFLPAQNGLVTNNYAVDPNYRLGYVQIWNADVQEEITPTVILNFDYTGTKGTRLDVVEAPNRTSTGLLNPNVQPFTWETSAADSTANAASVRARKRLQHGISIGGTYTFSKSIDNASSIGGGATVVAQDPNDLAAERGLSSFDQRHRFTADYLWELPFGHDKRWLTDSSAWRDIFGDWQWSGDWTIASGLPFTPQVLNNFADISRGTNGTLRPNVTGQQVPLSNPTVAEWFNTAAFVTPPNGQFGNARRNSIEGPGSVVFDMALTKVFPMKEARVMELRAQATNVFNTPQFTSISTVVDSRTYGQVTRAGSMRTVLLTARFRF
ncbi:MAG TPA: TonB-dependent receptor [Terriglobales bacterium]|jgi:hypothetical protein|nr:TonB-dependent receptor [Terriglobales bacterium]